MFNKRHYVINEDALRFFFDANAIFSRHYYFSEQLWRKVDGFKNKDEAEVKCAFLSAWTKETMGVITYQLGAGWCTMDGNLQLYNSYIEKWQPLFDDYRDWCMQQR